MGKPTGFMEYARQGNPAQEPLERIKHYNEFHPPLPEEERRRQGARCMECGVPFCQSGAVLGGMISGCPLHNLVPEWNDLVYRGNFGQALERLLKTNNFPEFTGRVCPALCEAACTCGLNGDPVTVKENELGIIESAYEMGRMSPRAPRSRSGKRVAVVGSGPAGLAAADQLNHRSHSVTVFEQADRVGGLLMYGIPNMKLEKGIVRRRVELMEAEGVEFRVNAPVATALRHGCKSVVQLEMMPKAPDCRAENNPWPEWPKICKTDYGQEEAIACFGADPRRYETTVERLERGEDGRLKAVVTVKLGPDRKPIPGSQEKLPCELLLIAAGFTGCREEVPAAFGLGRTQRGTVETLEGGCRTAEPKLFAAGDMRRGQSLVVWAIAEGRAAARAIDEYLMGYTNL